MTIADAHAAHLICSARGCGAAPEFALLWNNPSVHTPERRKAWLACAADLERLRGFLDLRGFLRTVCPVDEIPEGVG